MGGAGTVGKNRSGAPERLSRRQRSASSRRSARTSSPAVTTWPSDPPLRAARRVSEAAASPSTRVTPCGTERATSISSASSEGLATTAQMGSSAPARTGGVVQRKSRMRTAGSCPNAVPAARPVRHRVSTSLIGNLLGAFVPQQSNRPHTSLLLLKNDGNLARLAVGGDPVGLRRLSQGQAFRAGHVWMDAPAVEPLDELLQVFQ